MDILNQPMLEISFFKLLWSVPFFFSFSFFKLPVDIKGRQDSVNAWTLFHVLLLSSSELYLNGFAWRTFQGWGLYLNTCENPHVPLHSWGRWFQRGFLLHGGRGCECIFFLIFFFDSAQLVVPYWLVFILNSCGKGGFCQCVLITHSNMTPWCPFIG